MSKSLGFLKDFQKELEDIDGIGTSSEPPRYWYSMGNYVLNKIMSGSFYKGIPQGRVTNLAGPSGAGKSFITANIVREAQKAGAIAFIIDSENALDDEFMQKIGVNTDRSSGQYFYAGVTTVNDVTRVFSKFMSGYKKMAEDDKQNAQQVIIAIDSLDMLLTESELENYEKGDQKGDQGQKNKQLKKLLKTIVQDIKPYNVSVIVTSQVYKNQDLLNGEGLWIISDAVKYSASQLILLTKLKLKGKEAGDVLGVRIKAEGNKTRFTKPFQTVVAEVPYDTGMDPYSGLLEVALDMGIVEKKGSRYSLAGADESWYAKDIATVAERILLAAESQAQAIIKVRLDESVEEDDETESTKDVATRRKKKVSE